MPVSNACKARLRAAALSDSAFKDAELPAAVARILSRADVANAFALAKNQLVPEKITDMDDRQVLAVFESAAATLNAAIDEELTEEKLTSLSNDDRNVLASLLSMAFDDACCAGLKQNAAQFNAERFTAVETVGAEEQERHNSDYMTYRSGTDSQRHQVPIDMKKALEASKAATNIALALRLIKEARKTRQS